MLPGTAAAWVEGITAGRAWEEERDVPRIRRAFVLLITTASHWPTPARFIEVLPPPDAVRIAHEAKPVDPQWLKEELEKFRKGESDDGK